VDKPEFERRMAAAQTKLSQQEETLARHQQATHEDDELRLLVGAFETFAQQMTEGLEHADFATQRKLLRLLIHRIEVAEQEVRIVYKVPLRPFANRPFSRGFLQDCLEFPRTTNDVVKEPPAYSVCIPRTAISQRGKRAQASS
jgi:site-specific DNA recombinase